VIVTYSATYYVSNEDAERVALVGKLLSCSIVQKGSEGQKTTFKMSSLRGRADGRLQLEIRARIQNQNFDEHREVELMNIDKNMTTVIREFAAEDQ